jgi:hypothetical protein
MSTHLPPTSAIDQLIRKISQQGYDAGYEAGRRDCEAAEQLAQTNDNARPPVAVRDLKFAIAQLHPDRFHSDESSAERASRVTAWLLDELQAARS